MEKAKTMDLELDLKQMVLYCGSFGPSEIDQIIAEISRDYKKFDELKEAVSDLSAKRDELSPSMMVKLGVCQYLIGAYRDATATLKKGDGGALAQYYFAKIHMAQKDYDKAIAALDIAQKAGYNPDICALGRAEAYREMEKPMESLAELDKLSGAIEQTADYLYQRGATVAAIGGNPNETIALYERALGANRNHPGALFGLALENERRGNDDEALELYKRGMAQFPTHVGTLINLGVLYEDMEMYEQAITCFQRVLDAFPEDKKAAMFLKDAKASGEKFFDAEVTRKKDVVNLDLSLPVSDFELSVRSRNCLKNMGINTLGDLCRHTEQDLLGSKNFGETSLVEIKEVLTMKGLRLGMYAPEKVEEEPPQEDQLSNEEQGLMIRPVTDLNLSVRARKCLNRKNIKTIGELVRMTPEELLDCKNFGVTSLKEIREKLIPFNLKLRGE